MVSIGGLGDKLPVLIVASAFGIGERTAETVKIQIGSALPSGYEMRMEVRGRDLSRGVPATVTVNDSGIREALSSSSKAIIYAIKTTPERTPPELSADISDRGLVLSGGGGMLKNLDMRIRQEPGLPVLVVPDLLTSVVVGAGKMLNDPKLLRRVSMKLSNSARLSKHLVTADSRTAI